jgi:hypothetical protein
MKLRAFWAGLKHDVAALLHHKPDGEGSIPAWDPSIPKGMSIYVDPAVAGGTAADTADE